MMKGQKKFVHVAMKVNRPSIAAPGRTAGSAIDQKVRSVDAPSTREASMSSSGRASWRYCVIQKTPKALTALGMMTAQRLPIQPSLLMTMKSGTIPSCVGTAIVAMTKTSSPLRPRKRSLAKAKPAIAEKRTTRSETVVLTMMLLPSAFQKGTEVTTVAAFWTKWPPGMKEYGSCTIAAASLLPLTKDHQSGKAEASSTTMRKTYAAGLAWLRRMTLALIGIPSRRSCG